VIFSLLCFALVRFCVIFWDVFSFPLDVVVVVDMFNLFLCPKMTFHIKQCFMFFDEFKKTYSYDKIDIERFHMDLESVVAVAIYMIFVYTLLYCCLRCWETVLE
jgi:hypothetical protein